MHVPKRSLTLQHVHRNTRRSRVGRCTGVVTGVLRMDLLDCQNAGGRRQDVRIGQKATLVQRPLVQLLFGGRKARGQVCGQQLAGI